MGKTVQPRRQRKAGQRVPRKLASKERQEKACELFLTGYTYEEIAKELGYADRSGAWLAVEAALRDKPMPQADELRRFLASGLVKVWKANLPFASGKPDEDGNPTTYPDKDCADTLNKTAARLESIFGLAIKRVELTGKDGAPLLPTDLSRMSDDELEALARGPGKR